MRRIPAVLTACAFLLCAAAQSAPGLRERAEAGDIEAMNYLGYLLLGGAGEILTDEETGDTIAQDPAAGLAWLVKAASLGDAKAASNIGWLYMEGSLVGQDYEEGARWLKTAAEKGLPVAQSLLGDLYRYGRGVEPDSLAADSLYREALERGLADAGYKLYDLRQPGYSAMPPERLVEEGLYLYLRGAPSEGVKLFYLAADAGSPEALALLGDAYARAAGVPYDHDLSLEYYVKAAIAGNPSAQFVVGELLEIFPDALHGIEEAIGSPPLPADPEYWYEKAAEAGVTDAAAATDRLLGITDVLN